MSYHHFSYLKLSPAANKLKLSLLTDKVNIALLCMLKAGPSYPRRLSQLIGINESHVSERLKRLKKAGFIDAEWARIDTADGFKNVKQYSLKNDRIVISFTPNGIEVKTSEAQHDIVDIVTSYYKSEIPRTSSFVGRKAELEFLQKTPGIKVVWGIPGIGKTSLVSKYASQLDIPVFWHDVKQVDSLTYVLTKLAIFLNMQERNGLFELIKRGLKDRRVLLDTAVSEMSESGAFFVFDDFQRCMDRGIDELIRSMAERGINGVVITRRRLPLPGSTDLNVKGLSYEESTYLMEALGHKPLQEIIDRTHGHPLLISLACKSREPAADDYIRDAIFEGLSDGDLSILLPISVYRGMITLSAVQAVTEHCSAGNIINFIMSMEKMGVVTSSGNEFELNPLVRDAAYGKLQNAEEIHKRAGYFYYRKGSSRDKLESLYHFVLGGEYEMAIEVLSDFASFVDEGYGEVLVGIIDNLPATNNARLVAWLLLAEGSAMRQLSMGMEMAKQKLMESIKSAEEAMDWRAKALAMNNLGIIYRELGKIKQAKEVYREAMKVKGLDQSTLSRITYNLAEAELEEGELSGALRGMRKSMKMDLEHHDMRGYFVSRLNIDYIRFLLGQFDGLLDDLNDAAEKLKRLGLKSLLGYCYLHMAYTVLGMDGSPDEALYYLNLALELYALSGFRYMQAYTLAEIIINKAKMGRIDDALSDMSEVEKIIDGIEDMDVLGNVELARSVLLMALGDFPNSEAHLKRSMSLLSRDWVSSVRVKAWMGVLYGLSGDDGAQGLLSEVQNQLERNGCNALAHRLGMCSKQLKDGNWEKLCGFMI